MYQLSDWLPTTRKEMELRGWERADVILFSGDAYVDHPSFGVAVVGRILEACGLRVCIVPQPDWHGDLRDFKRLGRPRLFFGISPGCMDSMVNKYTAARRLRSEDAYSPDGRHNMRPEYPSIVYTQCLRSLYPDVPVVLGGIEASLRRVAHYDYWQDRIRPSILVDSQADMITYGMGDKVNVELVRILESFMATYDESLEYDPVTGEALMTRQAFRKAVIETLALPQSVTLADKVEATDDDIVLHSYEDCLKNPMMHAENFRHIEEESNRMHASRLIQKTGDAYVVVNPPYPPLTTEEMDYSFDLPYTRLPHPKYNGKRIPAFDMIKFSVNLHRGCFGGCAFCTISAHQGKFIMNRSKESILREVEQITKMPDFKGNLSDLGGPSANMYMMQGKNLKACEACKRPSCIHPKICPNLNGDHRPLLDIYRAVDAMPGIKHSYIGSGVRYDMLLHDWKDETLNKAAQDYTNELITKHVSGRLKVAPEHTEEHVLHLMRKPSFALFHQFKSIFDRINNRAGLRQQIIPYFISSHPGCTMKDMQNLSQETRAMRLDTDQVQDFTPTPLTVATTIFATGYHPYTMEKVFCEHDPEEKKKQKSFFFEKDKQTTMQSIPQARRSNPYQQRRKNNNTKK
ncbi:MAG: YgiQ family radical SAM protein [Bacteroidaceae bacterium]|nr:YgiQ family radical SAM protein [Bacteroidaceae bacterium]